MENNILFEAIVKSVSYLVTIVLFLQVEVTLVINWNLQRLNKLINCFKHNFSSKCTYEYDWETDKAFTSIRCLVQYIYIFFVLWNKSLDSDGQQFPQYQQNEQVNHLKPLHTQKKEDHMPLVIQIWDRHKNVAGL